MSALCSADRCLRLPSEKVGGMFGLPKGQRLAGRGSLVYNPPGDRMENGGIPVQETRRGQMVGQDDAFCMAVANLSPSSNKAEETGSIQEQNPLLQSSLRVALSSPLVR